MRDEFCANDGLMQDKEGLHQGELLLEIHDGVNSIRIYRFRDTTDPKEFFWESSPKIIFVKCPDCGDSIFLQEENEEPEEQHFDDCTYDKDLIKQELIELNLKSNDWEWDEIYYTQEAAFLRVFEFMRNKKNEPFKKFHDFIHRKEEKLRHKYNSGNEYDKSARETISSLTANELH